MNEHIQKAAKHGFLHWQNTYFTYLKTLFLTTKGMKIFWRRWKQKQFTRN